MKNRTATANTAKTVRYDYRMLAYIAIRELIGKSLQSTEVNNSMRKLIELLNKHKVLSFTKNEKTGVVSITVSDAGKKASLKLLRMARKQLEAGSFGKYKLPGKRTKGYKALMACIAE